VENCGTWTEGGYSMRLGDAYAERLKLLGRFTIRTRQRLSSQPVSQRVIRLLTSGVAMVQSPTGSLPASAIPARLYAVDASADQLQIARSTLARRRNVTFIEGAVEDDPLRSVRVDWVYSRFLRMHVGDVRRALLAMANVLTDGGALLLEIADVGSLRFLPGSPESDERRL
jgi:SAM-dependent methyltransferase